MATATRPKKDDRQLSEIRRAALLTRKDRTEVLCAKCGVVVITNTRIDANKYYFRRYCKCGQLIESCDFSDKLDRKEGDAK